MIAGLKKYEKAFTYSQKLLASHNIDEFPLDIFDFVSLCTNNVIIISKSEYVKRLAILSLPAKNKKSIQVKDARCYYQPDLDTYMIIYNEKQAYVRIRFSIAHELGHILLGHLTDDRTEIDRSGLDQKLYWKYEGEANTFAGNLLSPPILLNATIINNQFKEKKIANDFELSENAIKEYRYHDYIEWLKRAPLKEEKRILEMCISKLHPHLCLRCYGISYGNENRYCTFCGSSFSDEGYVIYDKDSRKITKRKGDVVKYHKPEVDENFRLLKCLKCENEDIVSDGDFCHICGCTVVNRCCCESDHRDEFFACQEKAKTLPSNARFCPYCGSSTSFKHADLLNDWEKEKEEIEDDYDFVDEEGLPF